MKASTDWSRSLVLGKYANGSIGMAFQPSDESMYIAWPHSLENQVSIRYVRLNQDGDLVARRDLELPGQLRAPRLALADGGALHLFWSSRSAGGASWGLWHALLDADGSLQGQATPLTSEDAAVGNYVVLSDANGGAFVAWDTGKTGAITLSHIGGGGEMLAGPQVVVPRGEAPSLGIDNDGNLHLAWINERNFYYASLPGGNLELVEGIYLASIELGTGDSLSGPVLGLSHGWGYLLWSVLSQSGQNAGTARSTYVAFQLDAPQPSRPEDIWILPLEDQPYTPYGNAPPLTQLAAPAGNASMSSDFILRPMAAAGQGEFLPVALAVNQFLRQDMYMQIAVAVFAGGEFAGYEYAAQTANISDEPALAWDANGYLHLAWREGAGGRSIYYATTSPQAIRSLDRIGLGDIVSALLQGSLEGFVGITLLPVIGFGWMLPGFLVIGIWKLIRDQDDLTALASWVPLVVALLIFQAAKFITLPTITTYVPFSAWLEIPDSYGPWLKVAVPTLIIVASFYVANRVRARRSQSAAMFYVVFCLMDAALTLAVYGVNFLGVY